ncbi:ABC transporter permease [Aneurinibacillus thermoaerophilus]|uniref:ABC transporter permease n=1 Tax=Aneurinibacillus thermoaerophilus TaxID=143495 RepID=UPI002E1FAEFF|nr:ABC transporter permease [Aneurinibacillus thermoaerophilus]MED0763555.1 ABC transporter permease [Aneurinibacillus thermoaerophilus]
MMDARHLWRRRIEAFQKEALGYARYVANSGMIAFLVFAFILAAYYYSQALGKIPRSYPVEWLIAFLFSVLMTAGTVRTFLKEADLVFLLPIESRMGSYFRASIIYTLFWHTLYIFLFLLAVWPLYTHRMGEKAESFLALLVFSLVLKGVNLLCKWQEERLREQSRRALCMLVRWIANAAILFMLFSHGFIPVVMLVTGAFLLAAFFRYRGLAHQTIHWERLVQIEKRMQARFYTFITQFVDVPHIANRVQRRSWAAAWADQLPFTRGNAYAYLYRKVFARSDLLPMFLRLTVIGWIVIAFIGEAWGKVAAYFIILSLTGAQLSMLRQYYRYVFWHHIYPVPVGTRQDAVVRVVFMLLLVQALVLYTAVFIPFMPGWHWLAAPVIGVSFSYVYSWRVLRKKV